jgi:hypothetical protein
MMIDRGLEMAGLVGEGAEDMVFMDGVNRLTILITSPYRCDMDRRQARGVLCRLDVRGALCAVRFAVVANLQDACVPNTYCHGRRDRRARHC